MRVQIKLDFELRMRRRPPLLPSPRRRPPVHKLLNSDAHQPSAQPLDFKFKVYSSRYTHFFGSIQSPKFRKIQKEKLGDMTIITLQQLVSSFRELWKMMVHLKHNVHLSHKKVHINQFPMKVVTNQLILLLPHQMMIWRLIAKQPYSKYTIWRDHQL
ncbi:unnamed protein product [Vicia faba]|uniref:Uncharacterized protein n=1 Tax=Vicia faba TaxID=3906 RepID=A0AAV1ABR0_VICFA|nr:unnamed protein product [Vicia faba]